MSRLPLIIGPLLAGMILSGCASSPWSAGKNNDRTSASAVSDKSTAATATNGNLPTGDNPLSGDNQPADRVGRLPAAGDAPAASKPPSKDYYPVAAERPGVSQGVKPAVEERPVKETANRVVSASLNAPVSQDPDNLQGELSAAIKAMEAATPSNPKTADELTQQARLRMLYVLAGRRDDALKPIPSAPPAMQEFWSKELYGLDMLLDSEKTPDSTRRAAESKQILCEAISRLGETAPLVVRNLSFCTAIQSYGCFTPFKKYEFTPDQETLLYAEIDNFAAESTSKGFHTQLRSSYQILDSAGQRVADHTFTTTEEYCQNTRRDFFIGYHLRMPKRINPGKYTLQMTIEDLKSQKVGQSTIEFTIKEAEK